MFLLVVQENAEICSDCEGLASSTGSVGCLTEIELVLMIVCQMPLVLVIV